MFDSQQFANEYFEVQSFLSDHSEAAQLWVCALSFPPNSMEFHAIRGYGLFVLKRYEMARDAFRESLIAPPINPLNPGNQSVIVTVGEHLNIIDDILRR